VDLAVIVGDGQRIGLSDWPIFLDACVVSLRATSTASGVSTDDHVVEAEARDEASFRDDEGCRACPRGSRRPGPSCARVLFVAAHTNPTRRRRKPATRARRGRRSSSARREFSINRVAIESEGQRANVATDGTEVAVGRPG